MHVGKLHEPTAQLLTPPRQSQSLAHGAPHMLLAPTQSSRGPHRADGPSSTTGDAVGDARGDAVGAFDGNRVKPGTPIWASQSV
jgi:hypothetical protein